MKQPAPMIRSCSERNPHLKHTSSGCKKEQWYLWLEHRLHALSNRCGWLTLSVSFWSRHAIAFVGHISCWEVCLKMRKPVTVISEIMIHKSLLFPLVSFILFMLMEYLERSKLCIFLQCKWNPSPILDIEKGPVLLELVGWQWENA